MKIRRTHLAVACCLLLTGAAVLLGAECQSTGDQDERARLAGLLRITAGSRVADVGAGDGDYAVAFAEDVGPLGHV